MYARDAKETGIQNEGKGTTLHTLQKALMNTSLLRLWGTTEALNKQTQMSPSFKLLDSLHFYIGRHSELEPSRLGFFVHVLRNSFLIYTLQVGFVGQLLT